jgi:propanediol dehydratase small subunit
VEGRTVTSEARRAWSGREASELSVDGVVGGELGPDDIRISPDTLRHQAEVARTHGNPQLAANFERAAELTAFEESEILALYELMRPGRSTGDELRAKAGELESRGPQGVVGTRGLRPVRGRCGRR